jgi:cysteine synthase
LCLYIDKPSIRYFKKAGYSVIGFIELHYGNSLKSNSVFVSTFDMVLTVSNEGAIETTRRLSVQEGLLVGTSSGGERSRLAQDG